MTDVDCWLFLLIFRLRQTLLDPQRGISPSRKLVYDRTSSGNLYSGPSRERSQVRGH